MHMDICECAGCAECYVNTVIPLLCFLLNASDTNGSSEQDNLGMVKILSRLHFELKKLKCFNVPKSRSKEHAFLSAGLFL